MVEEAPKKAKKKCLAAPLSRHADRPRGQTGHRIYIETVRGIEPNLLTRVAGGRQTSRIGFVCSTRAAWTSKKWPSPLA